MEFECTSLHNAADPPSRVFEEELRKSYEFSALSPARAAVDAGSRDAAYLRWEPDLASLQGLAEFQDLVKRAQ